MKRQIKIEENGIYLVFEIEENQGFKLLHFSGLPFKEDAVIETTKEAGFNFLEMNLAGFDRPFERHGNKHIVTSAGSHMRYVSHTDTKSKEGRQLKITCREDRTDILVHSTLQFYTGIPIMRICHQVENAGTEKQTINYISTFNYTGVEKEGLLSQNEKLRIHIPHNSWQREMNWKEYSLKDFGLDLVQPKEIQRSSNLIGITNTGNWSSKEYLPMACLENRETGSFLYWQIEHNGSWHWEIGDQNGHLYLAVTGPDELYSHWFKDLKPGDTFNTVPAAIGVSTFGFADAMGQLTKYRRIIRRKNRDNEECKIIFNDYMNCLFADPTTEKEIPLIEEAAKVGCEYYCIDAGWYAKGFWWDAVGEWKESRERFPGGIREVTEYIREKGMIPGLWLELEVMGINCELAKKLPDDWFFMRHGKRVFDRSRYQLDYRNPAVREYASSVIERLIADYGIGYIKMDYNIEPGIGTEILTDSVGDGLLEHERAYLAWLDGLFLKYPDLIIENCSSGGLRIDYAMLSRYSIQSTSDEEDYRYYATIAANSPTGLTPEQSAIWSYPLFKADREEVVFNMVNAMLLRIHQSGRLDCLDEEGKALVKEAMNYYKSMRHDIPQSLPFWPLGISSFDDEWVSFGLKTNKKIYLAVFRRSGNQPCKNIPIAGGKGMVGDIRLVYPAFSDKLYSWNEGSSSLSVRFEKENMARLFEITVKNPAASSGGFDPRRNKIMAGYKEKE